MSAINYFMSGNFIRGGINVAISILIFILRKELAKNEEYIEEDFD